MHDTFHRIRKPARLPRLLGAAWLIPATVAAGTPSGPGPSLCSSGQIVANGDLSPEWAEQVSKVCVELSSVPNTDSGARVRLHTGPHDLEIDAELSDGRTAHRHVQAPGDLLLTLEALLALPTPAPATDAAPPIEPERPPRPPRHLPVDERPSVRNPATIEITGAATGRLSRNPGYVSVGGEGGAGISIGRWLVELAARWDAHQVPTGEALPKGFEMDTIGAGFVAARHLPVNESLRFDVGVETLLAVETQSLEGVASEVNRTATDARLGLVSRAHWGKGPLHAMLALEGEISPGRLRRTVRIDDQLPALPAWSVGIGAGVSWWEP